jgi:5'-3' exonuclease
VRVSGCFVDHHPNLISHYSSLIFIHMHIHVHIIHSMKPCFVFDGKAPNMKSGELQKRREKRLKAEEELKKATEDQNVEEIDKQSKRLARAGRKENADCQKLLRLMGVPVYVPQPPLAGFFCCWMGGWVPT